ncbi:MAG: ATP-binding protein, partial [Ruminococcaceae bacterium]|nr:ATP-binding protein [Oscillospiraceae bacterium]
MVSRSYSMGLYGLDSFTVAVEADISVGLPGFDVVGLPDASVRESRDRVRSAMKNCGFQFPVHKITVNLGPADKRKEGPIYDLPLFVALMKASGQLDAGVEDSVFIGELSLTGEVRPVKGVLPMAIRAKEAGFQKLYVPEANSAEGVVVEGISVYPVRDLPTLMKHFAGGEEIFPASEVPAS